jgi:hypothetical protein
VLGAAAARVREEQPALRQAFKRLRRASGLGAAASSDPLPERVAIDDVVAVLTAFVEAALRDQKPGSRPSPESVARRRREALETTPTRVIVAHLGGRVAGRLRGRR